MPCFLVLEVCLVAVQLYAYKCVCFHPSVLLPAGATRAYLALALHIHLRYLVPVTRKIIGTDAAMPKRERVRDAKATE